MSKVAIKGANTGTATFTLEAPATNTDRTLVLPDNAGTVLTSASDLAAANLTGRVPAANANLGAVLQVIQTVKTNVFTTTTRDVWLDITGLNVSITPTSTSSRILVLATTVISSSNSADSGHLRCLRNSTAIGVGDAEGVRTQGFYGFEEWASSGPGTGYVRSAPFMFLDQPNTTSSITYKIQIQKLESVGTLCINRQGNDGDNARNARTSSSILVMEIAA